jgi:hypothetical protein
MHPGALLPATLAPVAIAEFFTALSVALWIVVAVVVAVFGAQSLAREVVAGHALLPPREVHRRRVDRGGRSLTGASGRRAFAQILSQSRRVCDPVLQP